MDAFLTNWLPNIICTVAGCILSWLIGYRQGRKAQRAADQHTLMLETMLIAAEKAGHVELARDASGRITDGRNITVQLTGQRMTFGQGAVHPRNCSP